MLLSRLILYSHNPAAQKVFYQQHFQLPLVEEIENEWVVLQAGSIELAFHLVGKEWRENTAPGMGSNAKIVFRVTDQLNELREKLIKAGVTMHEIKSYPGFDYDLCDGEDPEGNIFQLMKLR